MHFITLHIYWHAAATPVPDGQLRRGRSVPSDRHAYTYSLAFVRKSPLLRHTGSAHRGVEKRGFHQYSGSIRGAVWVLHKRTSPLATANFIVALGDPGLRFPSYPHHWYHEPAPGTWSSAGRRGNTRDGVLSKWIALPVNIANSRCRLLGSPLIQIRQQDFPEGLARFVTGNMSSCTG